jgi:hypothetical protein
MILTSTVHTVSGGVIKSKMHCGFTFDTPVILLMPSEFSAVYVWLLLHSFCFHDCIFHGTHKKHTPKAKRSGVNSIQHTTLHVLLSCRQS